jgi:aminopeptidase N
MTLQVLRNRIGDRAFFTVLRSWATQHRYGHGTTAQFIALSERVSHQNLDGLFQAWLFTPGKPGFTT